MKLILLSQAGGRNWSHFAWTLYHYEVRNNTRAQQLLEAAQTGEINLLQQLKKSRGSKHQSSCPDNIGDASGPEQISELFKRDYEELYNFGESVDAMKFIKANFNYLLICKVLQTVVK